MRRSDLEPGMEVADKKGRTFTVVDTGGWAKSSATNRDESLEWKGGEILPYGYRDEGSQRVLVTRNDRTAETMLPADLSLVGRGAAKAQQVAVAPAAPVEDIGTNPMEVFEVVANLLQILDRGGVERWMQTPLPRLGGRTPVDAFANGDGPLVVRISRDYLDPSFS